MRAPAEDLAQLLEAAQARDALTQRRLGSPSDLLRKFLAHAVASTPFYQDLGYDAVGGISKFPTITRDLVAQEVMRFLSSQFRYEQMTVITTSGTSGVPLSVFRDTVSSYAALYDVFRSINEGIRELRLDPLPGSCFALVVNDNPDRSPLTTVNPAVNCAYVRRIVFGNGNESDLEQIMAACAEQPPLICGRPRSLLRLAEELTKNGLSLRPLAIFSSGDNLYENERRAISSAFDCRVYNGYASQECGLIALECESNGALHFTGGRVFVEVLDLEKGLAPSATGEGELVVTNCDNWAMPLVRYRTGDIGVVEYGPCACGRSGPVLRKIDGRTSLYFHIGGRRINPSILNPRFEALPIRQFQVEQIADREFKVRWVPDGCVDESHVSDDISRFFQHCVGVIPVSIVATASIGRQGEKVQRYVKL